MTRFTRRQIVGSGLAMAALSGLPARAQAGPVRIAYIDPLSGFMAPVGDSGLAHLQFEAERINAAGGVAGGRKLEIVGFDNKLNPQESIVQLEKAIDQGIRYISQGNGSSVAAALIDAIEKHNARNPKDAVLFLNYAAVDPAFTNDKCSFWHFRFDADSDMKMSALTDFIKPQTELKRIYIIGQDYSFGKAVADAAVKMLAAKRPDIQIVGNELHPLAKVRDFSPYVTKIRASGAQAVITGNWGNDMTLLIKSATDSGFNVPFFTYYGGGLGSVAGMGPGGVGLVRQISEWHSNAEGTGLDETVRRFKAKNPDNDYFYFRIKVMMDFVARAMNDTKSAEPMAVASALEGMEMKIETGMATMRKDNHQLIQPLFLSTLSDNVKFTIDNTKFGFRTDLKIEGKDTSMATTCQMKRPAA
jgi:branched-chain amino acid transport system substrate-binding protein